MLKGVQQLDNVNMARRDFLRTTLAVGTTAALDAIPIILKANGHRVSEDDPTVKSDSEFPVIGPIAGTICDENADGNRKYLLTGFHRFSVEFILAHAGKMLQLPVRLCIRSEKGLHQDTIVSITQGQLYFSQSAAPLMELFPVQALQYAHMVPVVLGPSSEPVKVLVTLLLQYPLPGIEGFSVGPCESRRDIMEATKIEGPCFHRIPAYR